MSEAGPQVPVVLLLAGVALLPLVLVMVTSYAKVAVVLHILRGALGPAQVPPALVITGLALVLTAFIMAPTGLAAYQAARPELTGGAGASPLSREGLGSVFKAAAAARGPVEGFLRKNTARAELELFQQLARRGGSGGAAAPTLSDDHLLVLVPAFVVGQLKAAFLIGFLLFIPFIIVDLVVGNVLLSLGMHMLNPGTVALPFKLLLFVLADGWSLLTRGLVLSYA